MKVALEEDTPEVHPEVEEADKGILRLEELARSIRPPLS